MYFCRTKIEAIHNKDYSVVKTFKAGLASRFFSLLAFSLQPLLHLFHRFEKGVVVEAIADVGVRKEGDELHVFDFFEKGGDVDLVQIEPVDDGFLCNTLDGNLVTLFIGDDAAFVEERRARFKLRFD